MAKLSNESTPLKADHLSAKNVNGANGNINEVHTEWEFFKKTYGLITDYLNKQINIPSTAFTPGFVLPSKAILSKILVGYGILSGLNDLLNRLSSAINVNSSFSFFSKKVVKKSIGSAFGGK